MARRIKAQLFIYRVTCAGGPARAQRLEVARPAMKRLEHVGMVMSWTVGKQRTLLDSKNSATQNVRWNGNEVVGI